MSSLTGANVMAPPVPGFAVSRPKVVEALDAALRHRVCYMVAPPGFGKSVLLAQWAQASAGRAVAWLHLDKSDTDASRFGRHLVASLQLFHPGVGETAGERLATTGERMGDDFLDQLIDELVDVAETVVVLDDFHVLSDGPLMEEIALLIEHSPPCVHWAVVSRSDPPLRLHRLRMRDEVADLRQDALAMSESDAAGLIRRIGGQDLPGDAVRVLVARTEGWPAGLQLAALSLRGRDDTSELIAGFSGDHRNVAEYLTDEVLSRQPAHVRQFLHDTSVLQRMSGPLCDALTGRSDGQRMLEHLDRSGLFVVRLDDTRQWFRYHQLFRDLLRYELRASDPTREKRLFEAAADWYLAHDELVMAGSCLVATEDWNRVSTFVHACGRRMFERGEMPMVITWLSAVPERIRFGDPEATLTWAAAHAMVGRPLVADDVISGLLSSDTLRPQEEGMAQAIRATLVQWHLPPALAVEAADRALASLEEGEPGPPLDVLGLGSVPLLRYLIAAAKGKALHLAGRYREAQECLQALVESEGPYPVWTIHATGALAQVEADLGNLVRADGLADRALAMVEEFGLTTHPAGGDAYLALARVQRERGLTEQAGLVLDEARVRINRNHRYALQSLHRAETALLALARGEVAQGLELFAVEAAMGLPPAPPLGGARLAAVHARLLVAAGDPSGAEHVLDRHDGMGGAEVAAARVAVAVARRDVEAAAKALDELPDQPAPRMQLERAIWEATLDDLRGCHREARARMREVVVAAEPEGHVRLFIDSGSATGRLLRAAYHAEPTPYLRRLVEAEVSTPSALPQVKGMVDQLSYREAAVLRYLPSRLSNAEIAQHLYISLNTLKTHLKHIYRKLDVTNRSQAVSRAESLGIV
jgi:LuxR family maltose regulon positive regulatory protein